MRAIHHEKSLKTWSLILGLGLGLGLAAGCGDETKKRPIGSTCESSEECAAGLCYAGRCLDPEADDDGDGIINRIEVAQGSNPLLRDTDGDGIDDADEYDGLVARDTDGDGIPDVAESNTADADEDCIVDQLDARNEVSDGASSPRIPELCKLVGACGAEGAVLSVMCRGGLDDAACEYTGVPGYEAVETSCDGVDNDCDGQTDVGCDPLSAGLIGHWKLDGDGQDSGPFGDHGTVSGAIPAADRFGAAGKAMRFAALNDRIDVAATEHPQGEVTATYALWVKPDRGFAGEGMGYFSFGEVDQENRRSSLARGGLLGCTDYVGQNNDVGGVACAPAGHWSHIAVVKSGRSVTFYLDGRRVDSMETAAGQDLSSSALVIGLSGTLGGVPFEQFRGVLDDLRVWGRALSDAEVASVFGEGGTAVVGTQARPAQSCWHALEATGDASDGLRWVDVDGDGERAPLQLYCDMSTDGGGWALVWVYEFTNFEDFTADSNAVTPRPSWPVGQAQTPVSTTPPSSPTTLGALDWSLWRELGAGFAVTSDLADHIACEPGRGSLVHGTTGWVECRTIKDVTPTCDGVVPWHLHFGGYGPSLSAQSLYYYFDGNTSDNWPTHDPCGVNSPQHVANPARRGGAVWVRPTHRPVEWPQECNEVSGILRSNGMRRIDPDGPGGQPSFMAECRFDVERGGWTRLAGEVLETLDVQDIPREYLYTRGSDFYRSPVTVESWDTKGFGEVTGLWHHERAGAAAGAFGCSGGASGEVGLGCGPIPGGIASGSLPRVLPTAFDEAAGSATVCQAPPDVFGVEGDGCATNVGIWTRRHYCMPDEGQILGDGGFDQLANATEPWQSPCWSMWGPGGFGGGFSFDQEDVPPGAKAPSLKVDNPELGNLIYALDLGQRDFSVVAGRSYTLGFWAKAAAPRSMRVFVQPTTYDDAVFYEDVMLTTEWRYYALGFEARRTHWSTVLDFQLAESSTASIWLDDVSLTDDGPSPCGPSEDNVLGNGDFSLGRMCWRFGNRYDEQLAGLSVDPDRGPDGMPVAYIDSLGPASEGWHVTLYRRHVPLEAFYRYRLSFKARSETAQSFYANLNRWDLELGTWFNTRQPISGEWRTYVHDFVPTSSTPVDGATLELAFGHNGAGRIELADVRLEKLEFDPCGQGSDLLYNADFDFGMACWQIEWHWDELDQYTEFDPELNALRTEISNNAGVGDYATRLVQFGHGLQAGRGYVLKFESLGEQRRRGYTNMQEWPTMHMNQPLHYGTTWKRHEIPWLQAADTGANGAKLEIGFGGPLATGNTWLRGFTLVDLGANPCARTDQALVANGGFDKSHVCWELFRPWDEVRFEAVSDASTFFFEPPSIRLEYETLTSQANVAFSQRGLSLVSGQDYRLWFRARGTEIGGPAPFLVVFDEVGGAQAGRGIELTAEWQTYTLDFTANGTSPGRGVVELQYSGNAPLRMWVDDVYLGPAPVR